MPKSIVGIAKSRSQLEAAVDELQSAVSSNDISVLMPESGGTPELGAVKATKTPEGATTGVVTGGAIGGTGRTARWPRYPGYSGPCAFIAAGPIMAALSGAAAGATEGASLAHL
jgi:hypothetical protein